MGIDDTSTLHILSKESANPKIEIKLDQCTAGMFMAESIYNSKGAVMILKNTQLDSATINKLKSLGIVKVKVYLEPKDSIAEDKSKRFKEIYTRNLAAIKEVFYDIYSGKPLNMGKIGQLSDSILEVGDPISCCLKNKEKIQNSNEYLYAHSVNVSMLSCLIAKWMKLGGKQTNDLIKAGLLHDIGKTKMDPLQYNKFEQLSEKEKRKIKQHPVIGWKIVRKAGNVENDLLEAILMHHEREDGSGYPLGTKAEGISILARILYVANLFDNLASENSNGKALNPFRAFEAMQTEGFKGYNTEIILLFLENAPNYFIGEKFFLSNGEVGEVIFINSKTVHRPLIRVGERYIDLSGEKDLSLENML